MKFIARAVLSTTFVLLCLTACEQQPRPDAQSQVALDNGDVVGFALDEKTYAWLGIPYAAPPVGELRWRAPGPAVDWEGVKEALAYGPACVQPPNITSGDNAPESELIVGLEDCLYLNIFAPKSALEGRQPLPVMLWIHGGANMIGSAEYYDPAALAENHPVIVVSINYRLGLFGWLSHSMLRTEGSSLEDQSGNYGTLDIIAALHWVQNNIAQFGGDPNLVTIFGESAGGRNTWSMLASPLASGLFHRAIPQSGSLHLMDAGKAEQYDENALDYPSYKNTGAEIVSRLVPEYSELTDAELAARIRAMSPDEVYSAVEFELAGLHTQPRMFIDGHVFPQSMLEAFDDPADYNAVPVMAGSNRDEDKLFMAFDERFVDMRFGFLPKLKDAQRYNSAVSFGADTWRALAVDLPAKVISENGGAPVFTYRFDYDEFIGWPVDLKTLIGAAHGLELLPLFGGHDAFPMNFLYRGGDSLESLSQSMMSYWVEFAYSGDPGRGRNGEQPLWSRWQPEQPIMLLDSAEDGGVRMEGGSMTVEAIKRRLLEDTQFNQQEKCDAYNFIFINGYQGPLAFDEAEYASFADGGCPVADSTASAN